MWKKMLIVAGVAAAVIVAIIVVVKNRETNLNKPIAKLVAELGQPSFLANSAEIVTRKVKALSIQVPALDPQSVTNWNSVTNMMAIWAESEPCQRNARYFYDEMKNDKSFDGGGWYSSRSPFGEKLIIVKVDAAGNATSEDRVRVDAVAMRVVDFVPRKPPANQKE